MNTSSLITQNNFNNFSDSLLVNNNMNGIDLNLEFDFALCHGYYSYCCWR